MGEKFVFCVSLDKAEVPNSKVYENQVRNGNVKILLSTHSWKLGHLGPTWREQVPSPSIDVQMKNKIYPVQENPLSIDSVLRLPVCDSWAMNQRTSAVIDICSASEMSDVTDMSPVSFCCSVDFSSLP